MEYTKPLAQLIEFFQKFPGVGPKSAQRMAFHLLKMPLGEVQKFSQVLVSAKENIHYCSKCFNMSASDPCEICSDNKRDNSVICVVAETKDLIAIEKTREYKGLYHVLQGVLSPLDGIGAEDIRICTLLFKPNAYKKDIKIDYAALNIPNDFIVGYGLDYDQLGRQYKDIYVLDE